MAKIYPPVYPSKANSDDPECAVFELLKELPDEFHVFYSKKIVGCKDAKAETEIDFLIFDGKQSLICLEVKGGLIDYDGYTSGWSQNKKPIDKDPDRQASSACHTLIKHLGNDAKNLNVGWALAFPDCSKPPHMGNASDVPDDIILDERVLLNPSKAIQQVIDFVVQQHGRPGVSKNQAEALVKRFTREIHFIQKVGHRLTRDEKALVRATEEQMDVLMDLEVNTRCIVRGGAGTGKTLMAMEFAKRRCQQGDRVLLLFFNRAICNTVRYGLGRDSEITCATYHSLAKELINTSDPGWWGSQKDKDDDFWQNQVPLKLLETEVTNEQKFDTIIVDEGQDFKVDWFTNLQEFLKDPENGRFVVFYDENQDIFGHWEDVPWGNTGVPRKLLTKNCRNSRKIYNYLHQLITSNTHPAEHCPEGESVVIHKPQNAQEERDIVQKVLINLLNESVPTGDIVVLVQSSLAETSIPELKNIGKTPIEWMDRSYRRNSRSIQVARINTFKGLEAPVLLILGFDSEKDKNLSYTQASRANLLLHLFIASP